MWPTRVSWPSVWWSLRRPPHYTRPTNHRNRRNRGRGRGSHLRDLRSACSHPARQHDSPKPRQPSPQPPLFPPTTIACASTFSLAAGVSKARTTSMQPTISRTLRRAVGQSCAGCVGLCQAHSSTSAAVCPPVAPTPTAIRASPPVARALPSRWNGPAPAAGDLPHALLRTARRSVGRLGYDRAAMKWRGLRRCSESA